MRQALHIFAKDARHFWMEISISLVVTALFAWLYPNMWIPRINRGGGMNLQTLATIAMGLVLASWWILITRVVQEENLVGDQQWWITKPYEWPQLLGAKALFVLAFVAAPLICAQGAMVVEAGFRPWHYLPGMGFDLLLIAGVVVLPLLAMAAVTSSFGRMTLLAFGVLLALVAYIALMAFTQTNRFSAPIAHHAPAVLTLLLAGGAMVVQYARRRVWRARLVLMALLLIPFGLGFVFAAPSLIAGAYPGEGRLPLRIDVDPSRAMTAVPSWLPGREKMVELMVPITTSGLTTEDVVNLEGEQVTVQSADGRQWSSVWETMFGAHLRPNSTDTTVDLEISRDFLEQAKAQPVELRVRFAATELKKAGEAEVAMAAHDFGVPEFGVCAPVPDFAQPAFTGITCRAPLRQPMLTYITVRWSDGPCTASGTGSPDGVSGAGWVGSPSSDPAEFSLASVWSSPIGLSNSIIDYVGSGKPRRDPRRFLCPGTPMTVTRYAVVRRTQYSMTLTGVHIPAWQTPVEGGTAYTVGD
jgi:hypothetical protein